MGATFVAVDRETASLLPPDMRERVPADHPVPFISDAVEPFDLSGARLNERAAAASNIHRR